MSFNKDELNYIYRKTDGKCHICHKKLSRVNYANDGQRGAWQVEHSKAKAKGGTDHLNNLYPSCIDCNKIKGTRSSRSARADYGRRNAPLSKKKKKEKKEGAAIKAGLIGLGLGGLLFGGWGAIAGAGLLGLIGYNQDPEDE